MKWYRNLYLTESIRKDKQTLIEKAEKNAGLPGIYLVTLAANGQDLFDVFSASQLLQAPLHGHCPVIVGMAKGRDEAIDLALQTALEAYERNGDFNIRKYLQQEWESLSAEEKEKEYLLEKELHAHMDKETDEGFYFEYPMERLKKRRYFFSHRNN